jgi:hypothetical protein
MIRVWTVILVFGCSCLGAGAIAQIAPPVPDMQQRIPAPLPPPPEPPIINGPLSKAPPPGVIIPGQITTHSDRVIRCNQQGASAGLQGRRLSSYTSRCANDF